MKGKLQKTDRGWQVNYQVINSLRQLPLHPDYIDQTASPKVEFEIVECVFECKGLSDDGCFMDSPGHNCGCQQRYAKLINQVPDFRKMVEDDVEKLAIISVKEYMKTFPSCDNTFDFRRGFVEGYNKAKENTYTEEQVEEAIKKARMTSFVFQSNTIIQSLKQSKKY